MPFLLRNPCQTDKTHKLFFNFFHYYTLGQVGDYTLGSFPYLDLIPISQLVCHLIYFYGGLIFCVFAYVYCENRA